MGVECNGIEFDCNVNCEKIIFENEDGNELYCPTLYPTTYPAPRPPVTIINFNNSRIELRENLDLKYIFGVNCNGNGFDCNVNTANRIFENENDCGELLYGLYCPTPEPIDTPPPIVFNLSGLRIKLRDNLDLKYILGVECNGSEFDCNVDCENIIFENENGNTNNCGDYELLNELYCPTIYPTTYPHHIHQ